MVNIRQVKSWQWALLVLALLVALDWAIRRPDGRTRALNEAIQTAASPQLKNYPYPFHVMRVDGNTAIMGTPRNFEMPAFRFLGAMYPDVNVKDHDNPAFIALEKTLVQVQDEAKGIVLAQPGVSGVKWELDREWLQRHHLEVPDKPPAR